MPRRRGRPRNPQSGVAAPPTTPRFPDPHEPDWNLQLPRDQTEQLERGRRFLKRLKTDRVGSPGFIDDLNTTFNYSSRQLRFHAKSVRLYFLRPGLYADVRAVLEAPVAIKLALFSFARVGTKLEGCLKRFRQSCAGVLPKSADW